LLDEAGEKVVGDVTMFGNGIKRSVGGQREVVKELRTEQDRIEALREVFGVELTAEEREGISAEMRLQ